jgi:hypothetical protein
MWKLIRHASVVAVRVVLLLALPSACLAEEVRCKDYWHTESQWLEMSVLCEAGARNGEPVSQVAVAIRLLNEGNAEGKAKARKLLQYAATSGYDDAYYWLGSSQRNRKEAIAYLEMAKGSGGMGLFSLTLAADAHFKGSGVPKNFQKAREVYRRAFEAMVRNMNSEIPSPPGEWWTNAKWFAGQNAVIERSERYGFQAQVIDDKYIVVAVEPHPEFSDKELSNRLWKKTNGKK